MGFIAGGNLYDSKVQILFVPCLWDFMPGMLIIILSGSFDKKSNHQFSEFLMQKWYQQVTYSPVVKSACC